MNKKFFLIIPMVTLIFLSMLATVEADLNVTATLDFSYTDLNNVACAAVYPDAYGGIAQGINATNTGALLSITVRLTKENSPVGHIHARLTGRSAAGKPNATIYAESTNYFEAANLHAGVFQAQATDPSAECIFNFNETYNVIANEIYCFVIYASEGTLNAGNQVLIERDNTSPQYSAGILTTRSPGSPEDWDASGGDLTFQVMVGDSPAATASPGPLPTGGAYDTSNIDAVINALFGYLIPLLLWLIPAGLLGWLTHWAKWPLLIGLAIGGGLCYLFLGTQYIWMIMVTLIGLVGMAYSDYQGGHAQ